MKDQFKHARNRLRMTAWSALVSTDDLSMVRTKQMINQNTELDYLHLFYIHLSEYTWTQVSSMVGMATA